MPGCVFVCSKESEIVVDFCEQKERGCISMIKRTVTNDCCLGEATWLAGFRPSTWRRTHSLLIWLLRERWATKDVKKNRHATSCMWQLLRIYMLCVGILRACVSMCVQQHQILMGTWSLVRPHYCNFFWGRIQKRVSFIATTTELQPKARD